MLKWIKISAGEYKSENGRWHIVTAYDRVYGDHWRLTDLNDDRNKYFEQTLKECKRIANLTEAKENGTYKPKFVIPDNADLF